MASFMLWVSIFITWSENTVYMTLILCGAEFELGASTLNHSTSFFL
jgi:hypothetical protein